MFHACGAPERHLYQNGDKGTRAEGGPEGTFSEVAFFNGVKPLVGVVAGRQFRTFPVGTFNDFECAIDWLMPSTAVTLTA